MDVSASPRIATHLPAVVAAAFADGGARAIARFDLADVAGTVARAEVLLVATDAGWRGLPRPAGWPFGVKWVHAISAGIDGYPDWLFEGVAATRSAGVAADPVAEFCLAAIFAAARDLPGLWIDRAADWTLRSGRRVAGARLGIVGFGAIGRGLAARARALGMEVAALRRSDTAMPEGVTRARGLAELMAWSDHLVLAAPATDDTRHMIDAVALGAARPGLHLVNVARGALVDDAALLAALDDGRVARATLDVTDPEPLPDGHPFYRHPRVFLSPHSAASDDRVLGALADLFAENLALFAAGAPLPAI